MMLPYKKEVVMKKFQKFLVVVAFTFVAGAPVFAADEQPWSEAGLLTPEDSILLLVDLQPVFSFTVKSIDIQSLVSNATALAKTAQAFDIPIVVSTIAAETFGGPIFPELQKVVADAPTFDRSVISVWEDARVRKFIEDSGRKQIIIAGLWTDNCVTMPALQALHEGYRVYVVADACGDVNEEAHQHGMQRMVQAGAVPMTWIPVMLELQRDWANAATADKVRQIAIEHGGAMGMVNIYLSAMNPPAADAPATTH